jgi:ABC-type uncharacterized transport system fused permease/ATPase subunit
MVLGSLRDQMTYPIVAQKGDAVLDKKLSEFLELTRLTHLLDTEDGLDSVLVWEDILSLGEQQRLAMIRLFYHEPAFAVLGNLSLIPLFMSFR